LVVTNIILGDTLYNGREEKRGVWENSKVRVSDNPSAIAEQKFGA